MRPRYKQSAVESPIDYGRFMVPDDLLNPMKRSATRSRVGDDIIYLDCGLGPSNVPPHLSAVNLAAIDDPTEREFIRAAFFMAMNDDHDVEMFWRLRKVAPASIPGFIRRIRALLRWVYDRGLTPDSITQEVLGDWLEERKSNATPSTVLHDIIVWRRLWLYRKSLPIAFFDFVPWGNRTSTAVSGYKAPDENKTLRVPGTIYAPMLRWALFFIESGAADVINVREKRVELPPNINRAPKWVSDARIDRFVKMVEKGEAVLSCHADGSLHRSAIAAAIGLSVSGLEYRGEFQRLERLAEHYGKTVVNSDFNWSRLPDSSVPWCAEITALQTFRMLHDALAACYLIVALLSGMRDSEVTALRRGQLRILRDENGDPYRFLIDATIYKGRKKIEGDSHTWVVPKVVADAVAVAEMIQDHLAGARGPSPTDYETDLIFQQPSIQIGCVEPFTERTANEYIRTFAARCNDLAMAAADRAKDECERQKLTELYLIPNDPATGSPWSWATRQYRRTLAWFIANRPYGIVAGALQYGHLSSLMFEGYAGTSQSGYLDEIETERFLARERDIVAYHEDFLSGIKIGGPRGRLLEAEFAEIERGLKIEFAQQQYLDPLPGQIIGDGRRTKLLNNIAANLHPGFINDCFYYAEHAMCNRDKSATGPTWERCDAKKCPNSCIGQKHIPVLKELILDAEKMKADTKFPLQQKILSNQIGKYARLIEQASPGKPLVAPT